MGTHTHGIHHLPVIMSIQCPPVAGGTEWRGHYVQNGCQHQFRASLVIDECSKQISGNCGDNQVGQATIRGSLNCGNLEFDKTYRSTCGRQAYTCKYTGRMSPCGGRVTGTWTLGCDSGTFVMEK